MTDTQGEAPEPPELPAYLREPLQRQPPARLEAVATYARELAAWKRRQRTDAAAAREADDGIGADERATLERRGVSTDAADYDDVPARAYITVKTTKRAGGKRYRYYYWQWREGESWENEYIAPVTPRE